MTEQPPEVAEVARPASPLTCKTCGQYLHRAGALMTEHERC